MPQAAQQLQAVRVRFSTIWFEIQSQPKALVHCRVKFPILVHAQGPAHQFRGHQFRGHGTRIPGTRTRIPNFGDTISAISGGNFGDTAISGTRQFRGHNTNYRNRHRLRLPGPPLSRCQLARQCLLLQGYPRFIAHQACRAQARCDGFGRCKFRGIHAACLDRAGQGRACAQRWAVQLGVGGWGAVISLYWPHWLSRIASAGLRSIRARAAYRRR